MVYLQVAFFVGHRDQPPVAVSAGIFTPQIGAASSSSCRGEAIMQPTTPSTTLSAIRDEALKRRRGND
jgi:hypothetical protein